ncbi:MAG: GGDEF domain-containing protein, partial [Brevinematales bacterium]
MDACMVIVLSFLVVVLLFLNGVLLLSYIDLRKRHENQRLILTAINASEDIGYILSEILSLMQRVLKIPIAASVVAIAEESQLRVLYPSQVKIGRVYHFFSSMTRLEMYQFLLQCFSLTKNIFVTNILASTSDTSLATLSLFQRFQHQRQRKYNYLVIPIYDKEIAGLVVFEADNKFLFTYREAKRLQKSIPLLNIAFSRVLLLWNLRQQSITDPLTGLLNKRQFVLMAEKMFSLSKRREQPFSLAVLDIDNFKHINDTYGHHVG